PPDPRFSTPRYPSLTRCCRLPIPPPPRSALFPYTTLCRSLVRYVDAVVDLLRGDLGTSINERRPVRTILAETFPYTAMLAAAAIAIVLLVGIPLGILAAVGAGRFVDNLIRVVSLVGLSMPVFWTGIVFIVIFYV